MTLTADTPTGGVQRARAHVPQQVRREHAQGMVHGTTAVGRINTWIAVRVTNVVGSMWCAYVFAAIALVSLPAALRSHDTIVIVSWVAQTFLQLVLLSIIIVGQNVQAAASDARAQVDHDTLQAVHTLTVAIHGLSEQQGDILRRLDARP